MEPLVNPKKTSPVVSVEPHEPDPAQVVTVEVQTTVKKSDIKPAPGKVPKFSIRSLDKKTIAALLISIGLTFMGLAKLVLGDTAGAATDFIGAFGTAGLPGIWGKGLVITTAEDPPAILTVETKSDDN